MRTLSLLAATCLSAAAIPATTVLTLQNDPIPGQPGKVYGVLDIVVKGPVISTENAQSTLSGTVDGIFDIASGQTSIMTLANGVVTGTGFSVMGTVTIGGNYSLNATGLAGTFETPNPPGTTFAPGEFGANQHKLTVNQGSVTGSALGQTISETFTEAEPFSGFGTGIGTVTLTPAGTTGIYNLFDVVVIVPDFFAADTIVVGSGFTMTTVSVEGTGSIKATGTVQVPQSEYLAWTLAQNITGAAGQADANSDGIPNAIAWALGLGALDDAHDFVLHTANGGYEIQLPPAGTIAPISIEGSNLASAFLPISNTRISTSLNPLPPGSTGLITISRLADEFLRLKVAE